jgi:hypothetical protein
MTQNDPREVFLSGLHVGTPPQRPRTLEFPSRAPTPARPHTKFIIVIRFRMHSQGHWTEDTSRARSCTASPLHHISITSHHSITSPTSITSHHISIASPPSITWHYVSITLIASPSITSREPRHRCVTSHQHHITSQKRRC